MSQKSLRQWREREQRERFLDVVQRLELELRIEVPPTARRHLDIYLRLAERELEGCSATGDGFVAEGKATLCRLRRLVAERLHPNQSSQQHH